MRKEYTSISFPIEMIRIVDETIEGRGYTSRAEFVKECVRRGLERLQQLNSGGI